MATDPATPVDWRSRLEEARKPVDEAYNQRTAGKMATDAGALAERKEGLLAAWVGLGIPRDVVEQAIKRGSGAVDYLLAKGNLETVGRGNEADAAAAAAAGNGNGEVEVIDMTGAGNDPNAVPPPPPAAAVSEQAQMFAMTLGMEPSELLTRLDVDTLLELCGGSFDVALDMFLSNEAQCRELAPPKSSTVGATGASSAGGDAASANVGGALAVPSSAGVPATEVTLACGHVEAALPTTALRQVLELCTGIATGATPPTGFVEDGVCEYSDGMYTIVAPMGVDWA